MSYIYIYVVFQLVRHIRYFTSIPMCNGSRVAKSIKWSVNLENSLFLDNWKDNFCVR